MGWAGGGFAIAGPLAAMAKLEAIEFTDALVRLQVLVGAEIIVTVNFHGQFFGCALEGRLDRVETLPPDFSAIFLVVDETRGVFLDPADTQAFVPHPAANWLEFRLAFGAAVIVEPVKR